MIGWWQRLTGFSSCADDVGFLDGKLRHSMECTAVQMGCELKILTLTAES